jgi:hypothetical protein
MQYFWLRHFTLILVAILISPLMAVVDNDRKLIFLEKIGIRKIVNTSILLIKVHV